MRITVNLSLFFHDHRCLAKIFINENISTIKDLENRISEVFNIYDFYLKCDNQFLPPSEDVKILNYDDVVWALPKDENHVIIGKNLLPNDVDETQENGNCVRKKKKKNKQKELDVNQSLNPHKKKKYKKRQRESDEQSSEEKNSQKKKNSERGEPEEKSKKNKKKKCKITVQKTTNELECSPSSIESFDNCKSDNVQRQNSSVSVKSLVSSFETQEWKKCFEHSFTTVVPKMFNIVKTIIISHPKHKQDSETPTTCNESNLSITETSTPKAENCTQSNSENKSNEASDLMSSYCGSEPDVKNNNKRKRKRTRPSKRKSTPPQSDMNYLQKLETTKFTFIPTPLPAKEASGRHVRFKEESDVILSPESTLNKTCEKNCQENESKIVINDSSQNIEKNYNFKEIESNKIINLTEVFNKNELTEEFIMKQPLMENIQPRDGDIIAFKILRISENYTPEVSSRIIGKVFKYDSEKMNVTFVVLYGQDQFSQPQGKFSIDNEMMEEEKVDNFIICAWSSVLNPRLLYP